MTWIKNLCMLDKKYDNDHKYWSLSWQIVLKDIALCTDQRSRKIHYYK
jgi:hypothetical protein